MNRRTDVDLEIQLMRRLAGELPPDRARALDRRLAEEPALAARYRALERSWRALAPPPDSPLPAGLTARVMAEVRGGRRPEPVSWRLAPPWVRAAAALALAAGVALGVGLGFESAPPSELPPMAPGIGISAPESLATSYWTAIEDATAEGGAEPDAASGARP